MGQRRWYCGDCWAEYDASAFCGWAEDALEQAVWNPQHHTGDSKSLRHRAGEVAELLGTEEGGGLVTLVQMGFGVEEAITALCAARGGDGPGD